MEFVRYVSKVCLRLRYLRDLPKEHGKDGNRPYFCLNLLTGPMKSYKKIGSRTEKLKSSVMLSG
jgi:hypothetical protein